MANKVITMNGVSFYPTSIERSTERIGLEFNMASGARRFFYRTIKRTWTITWQTAPESILTAIRGIYNIVSTFTYVDEFGVSYTVMCSTDPYSETLEASKISINGTFYYDIEIVIKEV